MGEMLCVHRRVKIVKQAAAVSKVKKKPSDAGAIISYGEKLGIQAVATTAPDWPPESGCDLRTEHEYECHDTVRLLAGIS
jgi:hypothetical protein